MSWLAGSSLGGEAVEVRVLLRRAACLRALATWMRPSFGPVARQLVLAAGSGSNSVAAAVERRGGIALLQELVAVMSKSLAQESSVAPEDADDEMLPLVLLVLQHAAALHEQHADGVTSFVLLLAGL